MKTSNLIKKIEKAGYAVEFDGKKYTAKSETQYISFWCQNGEATCVSTSDLATLKEDRENFLHTDCSYKTFHDTGKALIEWVKWCDERYGKRENK